MNTTARVSSDRPANLSPNSGDSRPFDITRLTGAPFHLDEAGVVWVEETLHGMRTEDKLRQLFCLVTYSDDQSALERIAGDIRPGGIMCRPMPLVACRRVVDILQSCSAIPLLIAANLEAGGSGALTDGTQLGRPMQLAAAPRGRAEWARRLGAVCGAEGAAAGINWAFAPVADIDTNWRNPITNTRTFGSDPGTVGEMAEAYIAEVQKHGLAAAVKHFPGDGQDERDQHIAPSVNSLSVEDWDRTYGQIYRRAIRAGVRSVMVGHILFPAWSRRMHPGIPDRDILPATVSYDIVTTLLRDRLGFDGLIVTDASTMAGLAVYLPRHVLVPAAIAAGCDMFLFTKDTEEDIGYMEKGFRDGIITPERLDMAVTRILALKASLGLHRAQAAGSFVPPEATARSVVACPDFRRWAAECAAESITLVKQEPGVLPLTPQKYPRVLFVPLDNRQDGTSVFQNDDSQNLRLQHALEAEGFSVTVFQAPAGFEGMMTPVREMTERYDLILYAASLATRSNQTVVRITWQNPMGVNVPVYTHTIPTVFISLDNPYHLIDVPLVRTYINCYAGNETVIRALMDKLTGRAPFVGVSPVDPFCGRWEAKL